MKKITLIILLFGLLGCESIKEEIIEKEQIEEGTIIELLDTEEVLDVPEVRTENIDVKFNRGNFNIETLANILRTLHTPESTIIIEEKFTGLDGEGPYDLSVLNDLPVSEYGGIVFYQCKTETGITLHAQHCVFVIDESSKDVVIDIE